jgi:hypothetical protein
VDATRFTLDLPARWPRYGCDTHGCDQQPWYAVSLAGRWAGLNPHVHACSRCTRAALLHLRVVRTASIATRPGYGRWCLECEVFAQDRWTTRWT